MNLNLDYRTILLTKTAELSLKELVPSCNFQIYDPLPQRCMCRHLVPTLPLASLTRTVRLGITLASRFESQVWQKLDPGPTGEVGIHRVFSLLPLLFAA